MDFNLTLKMDWESQVTQELQKAESERASLKKLICSNGTELSTLKRQGEQAIARIDSQISTWQRKRKQLDDKMSYRIFELSESTEKCHNALQTVEETIAQ